MAEPLIVHEDDVVRISYSAAPAAGNGRVLISFTGIGHSLGGIDVQSPEFTRAGDGYDGIYFISDIKRSWGNNLDFDAISRVLSQTTPGATFDALGNSMGGFIALLAAGLLGLRAVVAFVPQYSVHPGIVPWEKRWPEYRKAIRSWKYPSLDGVWREETRYFIFAGNSGSDARQAAMMPERENLQVIRLSGGHDIAQQMKDAGLLHAAIRHCFDGTFSATWLDRALRG